MFDAPVDEKTRGNEMHLADKQYRLGFYWIN